MQLKHTVTLPGKLIMANSKKRVGIGEVYVFCSKSRSQLPVSLDDRRAGFGAARERVQSPAIAARVRCQGWLDGWVAALVGGKERIQNMKGKRGERLACRKVWAQAAGLITIHPQLCYFISPGAVCQEKTFGDWYDCKGLTFKIMIVGA